MVARPEYRGTASGFAYIFVKLPSFLAIFLFPVLFAAIGQANATLFTAIFPLIGCWRRFSFCLRCMGTRRISGRFYRFVAVRIRSGKVCNSEAGGETGQRRANKDFGMSHHRAERAALNSQGEATMALVFHERVGLNGLRISPFSWRIRYALAHKGSIRM